MVSHREEWIYHFLFKKKKTLKLKNHQPQQSSPSYLKPLLQSILLVALLPVGGYCLNTHTLAEAFCLDCWRVTNPLFKGSGLGWRLLAQRKSIVDAELTQFTYRETVGGHLWGWKCICVRYSEENETQHKSLKGWRFPVLFWLLIFNTFNLPSPSMWGHK